LAGWLGYAQPNFNLKEIGDLPIPKFSLAVQKHISVSLRNLDSKIALNRRINQTLEAMAQAIFKSWFVDFDPVKAKIAAIQEGRDPLRAAMIAISGKPDTELDALPPEQYDSLAATAALFPDEMEESELGDIPRGWACGALGDICSFTAGSAFKPEHQGSTEGEFPFIKVSDMNLAGNEVFIQSANNYVSKSQQSEMKAKLHPSGATVFAKIGVALISNRRRLLTTPTIIDNNLMSANLVEGKSGQYFLYSLLSTFDFNTLVSGTALPYINVSDLKKIPIVRPPYDACHAFEAKASSFFSMMQTLASQSLTLVTTRDTLLPKLLSGEIEVSGIFEG
jgi:type I restriction enzyme S subunit